MKLINPQADASGITIDAYAHVTVTAGVPALTKASSNITSITDRGVGLWTLNMDALASADYCVAGMVSENNRVLWQDTGTVAQTTIACPIAQVAFNSAATDDDWSVMITGA